MSELARKIALEVYIGQAMQGHYGMEIAEMYRAGKSQREIFRELCFNHAYGVNEFPEREVGYAHVIPDLIKKILNNQYPLELLGDGQQTRCFTHVSDVASGVIAVALHPNGKNQDFNIGSEHEIKMIDLAQKIWAAMNINKPFKLKYVPGFEFDIKKRVPNVQKIKRMIDWHPRVKFENGLKEVIIWLKAKKDQGKL